MSQSRSSCAGVLATCRSAQIMASLRHVDHLHCAVFYFNRILFRYCAWGAEARWQRVLCSSAGRIRPHPLLFHAVI